MPNKEHWLLLTVAAAGDVGLTPVQLQKSVFLLGRGLQGYLPSNFYRFVAHNYGPFDGQVYRDAERLMRENLVELRTEGRRWPQYFITREGEKRALQTRRTLSDTVDNYIHETVAWTQSLSFPDLVTAIYRKYPEYRVNSIFRP